MKTSTKILAAAGLALAALSGSAMARDHVSFGLSIGVPAPVYAAPAPVYVPPPAYYPPAPVYAPAPVYGPPAVVYSRGYYGPYYRGYYGHGYYGHRHWR